MHTYLTKYYENYTPAADIVVMAMCFVFLIMILRAYINKTKTFTLLKGMIYMLIVSAVTDILSHMSMNYIGEIPRIWQYISRVVAHMSLFTIMWLYVLYAKNAFQFDKRTGRIFIRIALVAYFVILGLEVVGTPAKFGFYIEDNGTVHTGLPIFPVGYLFYVILLVVMVFKHKERVYRQVIRGVVETAVVAFVIMIIQQFNGQSSFNVVVFLFPVYALLYLVHSSPYDIETGTVSEGAFEDLIYVSGAKRKDLYLMSLYMHDFEGKGRKYPKEIQTQIRRFTVKFFKAPTLFNISGGHMVLVADKKKDPDYIEGSHRMLEEFNRLYPVLKVDYKIVYLDTYESLSEENDYVNFIRYMHDRMEENSVVVVTDKEVDDYMNYKYIAKELSDIAAKGDLDDNRVKVFCQPVYSIKTRKFETAEALMRIELPFIGMVYPDIFIPIAEKNGYIYPLTKIILNKTCKEIKSLVDRGYSFKRISVNFSVYDLREESFCSTISEIIAATGIDFGKVAIELTESQNESDFEVMKEKVTELKDSGIKFYLDDFGTGYSNFERIMELPFDIVKFDRSLVTASGNDEKFRVMVTNLAKMFNEVHYSVLYEGIENENDELRCIDMSAKYLQGYKYSKPIPIEKLTEYFEKIG